MDKVTNIAEEPIKAVFTDPTYGKVVYSFSLIFLFSMFCGSWCFFSILHLDDLLCTFLQFERGEALDNITQDVKRVLEEEGDEESLKVLSKAVDTVRKKVWSIAISLQS